jgi:hypothetical protein
MIAPIEGELKRRQLCSKTHLDAKTRAADSLRAALDIADGEDTT